MGRSSSASLPIMRTDVPFAWLLKWDWLAGWPINQVMYSGVTSEEVIRMWNKGAAHTIVPENAGTTAAVLVCPRERKTRSPDFMRYLVFRPSSSILVPELHSMNRASETSLS